MYANNPAEFVEEKGFLGWFHYLVFPGDLFITGDEEWLEWRETRFHEVTPILCWLIPLIILLSGTTALSNLGVTFLFVFEIIILTLVSVVYLACWEIGSIMELGINYAFSFIILGLTLFLILFFWEIIFFFLIVLLIAYFRDHFDY